MLNRALSELGTIREKALRSGDIEACHEIAQRMIEEAATLFLMEHSEDLEEYVWSAKQ